MLWLRTTLLSIALGGALLSAAGLGATLMSGPQIEDMTRGLVSWQVTRKLERLAEPVPDEAEGRLAALRRHFVEDSNLKERLLGSDYPERVAERLVRECICRMDAAEREATLRRYEEAKRTAERFVVAGLTAGIAQNRIGIETLDDLISGYYLVTVEGLVRDLRIFFGSNLALYALTGIIALLTTILRPLIVPAAMLLTSTLVAGGLYLFGQNWLATILFHSWTGFWYLAWVGLIFLFQLDVVFNQARVTLTILQVIEAITRPFCAVLQVGG